MKKKKVKSISVPLGNDQYEWIFFNIKDKEGNPLKVKVQI